MQNTAGIEVRQAEIQILTFYLVSPWAACLPALSLRVLTLKLMMLDLKLVSSPFILVSLCFGIVIQWRDYVRLTHARLSEQAYNCKKPLVHFPSRRGEQLLSSAPGTMGAVSLLPSSQPPSMPGSLLGGPGFTHIHDPLASRNVDFFLSVYV